MIVAVAQNTKLLPHHLAELRGSGLSDDTIRQAGIHSEERHDRLAIWLNRKRCPRSWGPGIVYPYINDTGDVEVRRVKFDNPPKRNGKPAKYLSPVGATVSPYILPSVRERLSDVQRQVVFTEGEKKTACLTQHGVVAIGLQGVDCWHEKRSTKLLSELERIAWQNREVYIVFDSDAASNENVSANESLLAAALTARGAKVKVCRVPSGADDEKQGIDDYLVRQGDQAASALHELLDEAQEPDGAEPGELMQSANNLDPATEATRYFESCQHDGVATLRFYRGEFIEWRAGCYHSLPTSDARARFVKFLNRNYTRLGVGHTNSVLDQARALAILDSHRDPPAWIGKSLVEWPPDEILPTRNRIIHLPSLVAGGDCMLDATPRYFCNSALDYDFDPAAPRPSRWYQFLNEILGHDQGAIDTLQDFFGYCLTPDTSLQKMFFLLGPRRAGKGVIARVLRAVVGKDNVAAPTLSSLENTFGLQPLVGKPLAIISDARLSGRADQQRIVERLLSVTGEDAITIDRKYLEAVTCKLPTRFVILSNELPRLGDTSGALIGRLILVRLTKSFYGAEDPRLTDKLLDEVPGILLWAIEGWRRLRERGRFLQPDSALELLAELGDLSSPISAFVRDRCVVEPARMASIDDLYDEWRSWCDTSGRDKPGTKQTFGRDLLAAVPTIRRTFPRNGDTRYRAYDGIGLRVY